ncbi:phytanoyl-CoA dioxygenase [Clostridium cellulovorans]|uniref:Phytanoyl-CoA dioxygenase (PhyH) family n=1 Tax=Clostridium cellulovorans (strain ATCC 35296 / DSM 3052 / OCM 3 / 743B) TaxID=573061 RepID=D9SMM3_CLOC7|nr:phytanoyl-CoA dioxygenase [Clostridium cellulovorans]ADL49808.1 phytanoyl-CoA dioxygenase (PhyH) family [Clostridium cellulovorans 743B]
MDNYREKLKKITETLLKDEDDYGEIKKATDDLYDVFVAVSDLKEDDASCREDVYLSKGKAIGTVWAAMCIKEFMRTKRFIKGVFLAIKEAQKKFKDTQIHILYAGTGPFATLILPLTTMFSSEEIKVTLLEINSESIKNLKTVISVLGAASYIEEIVQCDATTYKVNKDKNVHMIVTETMQRALKKEPQVSITLNLVPQMIEGGILVPQNVTVSAALIDPKRDLDRIMGIEGADEDFCYMLGKVFELTKDTTVVENKEGYKFPEIEIQIPMNIERRFRSLNLLTDIQVFGEEKLTYLQCSLNLPQKLMYIEWEIDNLEKFIFEYIVNETPGFMFRKI